MKFRLILMVLGWRLAWLAGRDEGFRKQLAHRDGETLVGVVVETVVVMGAVGHGVALSNQCS